MKTHKFIPSSIDRDMCSCCGMSRDDIVHGGGKHEKDVKAGSQKAS